VLFLGKFLKKKRNPLSLLYVIFRFCNSAKFCKKKKKKTLIVRKETQKNRKKRKKVKKYKYIKQKTMICENQLVRIVLKN
jgi:hypothetical protein